MTQVTVYGEYGRMDRRVFMGVAQIMLNRIDFSTMVIGWYKLYTNASLTTAHHGMTTSTSGSFGSRRNSDVSLDLPYNSLSGPRS